MDWRTIFWLGYTGWMLSELYILARDWRSVRGEGKDRGSRSLVIASIVGAIVLAMTAQHLRAFALPLAPMTRTAAGVAIMAAGIVFRLWSVWTLGAHFRTKVTVLEGHRLIRHGPYARIRNPSYSGSLVTCLGFGIALGNIASIAAMLLVPLIGFVLRIRVEEQALSEHFGPQWSEYRARTWALLPPVW